MLEFNETRKTGYLNHDFRLFHIKDTCNKTFDLHYHDFDKVVIFISGKASYHIDGISYNLKPWDILLINHYQIHQPHISSDIPYERIIIWIKPDFIRNPTLFHCDLSSCFKKTVEQNSNLIRLDQNNLEILKRVIKDLEASYLNLEFGQELLTHTLFTEFMIYLNRFYHGPLHLEVTSPKPGDRQMEEILNFINLHLLDHLTNDQIAEHFYINKYYLMHKFKKETGYTLHNYILQKRIFLSVSLIREGMPITKASEQCGFNDYSAYLRAFQKIFKKSPRDFLNQQLKKEITYPCDSIEQ